LILDFSAILLPNFEAFRIFSVLIQDSPLLPSRECEQSLQAIVRCRSFELSLEISIIIPVYNEQENILPVAREIIAVMTAVRRNWELVFVDDCSSDATWDRIGEAHQLDRRVRGLRHLRNCGQSAALWTGFQGTTSPILATLDGDLQNDPADLPRMLDELASADFVSGTRTKRADSWVRRTSSKIARLARRAVLKVDIQDSGCAMRLFRRTTLAAAFPFNGLHRFLPVLVASGGFKTVQIPVNHRPRNAGVSKYGIGNRAWRGLLDLFAIAWFQKRRLKPVDVASTADANRPAVEQHARP
jgi:glycosyltransferase involved in cell wall biosynthesis